MDKPYFDDVRVGDRTISAGRTVTEADVVQFAMLSGDWNPLHVDAHPPSFGALAVVRRGVGNFGPSAAVVFRLSRYADRWATGAETALPDVT